MWILKHPWAPWSSPSWQPWPKWNYRSNANASPTPSPNTAPPAATSVADAPPSLNPKSAPHPNSSKPANLQPKLPRIWGCPVRRSTEESKTRILLYSPSPPRVWTQELTPFLSGATRGRRNIHPGAPAAVTTTHRPQQVAIVTVIPLFQIPVLGIRKRRAPVIGQ